MSKKQENIPTSKLARASKIIGTSAKVGGNYIKHYSKKAFVKGTKRSELDEKNAKDIYSTLSKMKGSPLKVAQMLSMGEDILPKAYMDQFAMAQNMVPPLSYPLVRKTFKKEFGKHPEDLFDSFSKDAVKAASIGQVHKGLLNGKDVAIKVQYPGVADSIVSDLNMVKPLASKIMKVKAKDIEPYMKEVEAKLLEETNYDQELKQSIEITEACQDLSGLKFPKYFPEYSCNRILTMSWIDGLSFKEWLDSKPNQESCDSIGQSLWDFYQFQIHTLHMMHADPHPGNFIITKKEKLAVIDFGCMKKLPSDFYQSYIKLLKKDILEDKKALKKVLTELELLDKKDDEKTVKLVLKTFKRLFGLVAEPFHNDRFDFSDPAFFQRLFATGEELSKDKEMKKISTRGSRHFIYFNRTYFGLFQLLHQLKANIDTSRYVNLG